MASFAHRSGVAPRRRLTPAAAWVVMIAWLVAVYAPAQPPAASPQSKEATDEPKTLADAEDLWIEGSYDEAIRAYEIVASNPKDATAARLGIARCRMQTGRYREAIADLNSLDAPDSSERHYLLSEALRVAGDYETAMTHAREASRINAKDAAPRRLLGELLELVGRRDEAIETYRWFDQQLVELPKLPRDARWITHAAVGLLRYSVLTRTDVPQRTRHALNEMLQVAYERIDRTYWPARIAAADLLRERYNNSEEDGSLSDYLAALKINKNLPQAMTGIGEAALEDWNFEEVEARADAALKINPNFPPAVHLLARKFILERRYPQAIEAAERALTINPNDLIALSLSAAASACHFDAEGVRRTTDRAAALNPKFAPFHRIMGDALAGIRQYADSEREYLKAIELDPTDANARTELGMMYMQWGIEAKARDALDGAWALDPFNERAKFTLELLEQLHRFAQVETEHFIVRYDPTTDPGLGDFAAGFLEDMYASVTGDYEMPLTEKTIVEVFPTLRAFGVRITGKPWIHTVGASTGRVIALASPRDVKHQSPYHLGHVLKHEFTHTVTLEATNNRIPHWFTEGLAVMQEDSPRSFEWCVMLSDAVRRDRLFTLESIDWGFIRPRTATDRPMAYAQSEWMCEYIVHRFGYDSINPMLARFRRGQTQKEVFTEGLGVDPDAFHRDFREWARAETLQWGFDVSPPENSEEIASLVRAEPENAALLGRLARAHLDAGNVEGAWTAAQEALKNNDGEANALKVLAKIIALRMQEEADAATKREIDELWVSILERLLTVDRDGWTAPKYLAEIALRRGELDRAMELYHRLQGLCPIDPASWRGIGGILLQRGDLDAALPQLVELARLDENNAEVTGQIASIYRRRGQLRDAQHWYRTALCIAPYRVDLHAGLADTTMQAGDTAAALRAYRQLTVLEPREAKHFEKAAFAAHKLGQADTARELARQAVALDPSSSAQSLLP